MAFIGAAAILVANGGVNRRRGPNIHKEGCISAESDRMSVRLHRNEVGVLAAEYARWRRQTDGVTATFWYSKHRIRVFLLYLAKGRYYRQLGRAEGLAEPTAMRYMHSVATFSAVEMLHDCAI